MIIFIAISFPIAILEPFTSNIKLSPDLDIIEISLSIVIYL